MAVELHQVDGAQAPLGITQNLIPSASQAGLRVHSFERHGEAADLASFDFSQVYESKAEADKAARRLVVQRRYALQSAAVGLVPRNHRLKRCLRNPLGSEVGIVYSEATGSAHFRNLETCGSVWACPVCSAKISERRRSELGDALNKWRNQYGGVVWLVTLTFSHSRHDSLPVLLRQLSHAMRLFQGGKAAVRDKERFGWWGQVRSLEVTHGRNGWHPHIHMLVFLDTPDTHYQRESMRQRLFARWERACARAGLGAPTEKHGVRVDGYHRAGEYVTKWGLEHELTKQVSKEGRKDSRTPMGLLADFLETGELEKEDGSLGPGALFSHFAWAFRGQRQLVWSRGMREVLGMGAELTDEQLAEQDERQLGDVDLVSIPGKVWRLVTRHEVRGRLITLAALGDAEAVKRFLRSLPGAEGLEVSFFEDPQYRTPRRLLEVWADNLSDC